MNTVFFRPLDKLAGWWLTWRTRQEAAKHTDLQWRLTEEARSEGVTKATYMSPMVASLADEAAAMLESANAQNYVHFDMWPRVDRCLPAVRVTVGWANGEMPAAKAARLEEEMDKLEGERDKLLYAFWDLLDAVVAQTDDTLWAAGEQTAHEALADLADSYNPVISAEFDKRLAGDWENPYARERFYADGPAE